MEHFIHYTPIIRWWREGSSHYYGCFVVARDKEVAVLHHVLGMGKASLVRVACALHHSQHNH